MTAHTKKEEMNPLLAEIVANLDNFVENINCLKETFDISKVMLREQQRTAVKNYEDFLNPYRSNDEKGNLQVNIPDSAYKQFSKIEKRKCRAEKALQLIPPTYIVSLVSMFDSFLAGLVRNVYSLKETLLLESNMTFSYRQISEYSSVREVRKNIIDNTIDKLFRDSHTEQIEWLEKAIDIKTLRKFAGWAAFIELTERRNLFVHSDGLVSSQYINECKKNDYEIGNVIVGSKLTVDESYFHKAYELLYEMAINLTQIVVNKLYIGAYTEDTGERDTILIRNVYDLICEKHYEVAINVSNFARDSKVFKRNNKDKTFIELNLAQAYKWAGKEDKCHAVLKELDTSAMNLELRIPKMVLEGNFDDVYNMMINVGSKSEILNKEAYREWPIFKDIRKQDKFVETFEKIFDEPFLIKHFSSPMEPITSNVDEVMVDSITE